MSDCLCMGPGFHEPPCPYAPDPDACVDSAGMEWVEHDYPPPGHGNECSRCGAEADWSDA